jgi:hypothetical protein
MTDWNPQVWMIEGNIDNLRRMCPDRGGSGIAHCCDGLQEQQEQSDWLRERAAERRRI